MKLAWILSLASVLPRPVADQTCLAATVYLEARSEPAIGQLAVAEVALRRRENGRWSDDLCKVLTARGQFALSTTSQNYDINEVQSWLRAWTIAGTAMNVFALPEPLRMIEHDEPATSGEGDEALPAFLTDDDEPSDEEDEVLHVVAAE